MNRSPWTMVFWTVFVLVGTTLASYVPWNRVAPPLVNATTSVAAVQWTQLDRWVTEQRFALALHNVAHPLRLQVPLGVTLGAAALLVAATAFAVAWAIRARRRRIVVLRLAQRGSALNEIARDTRLSQDAVRLLMSPMIDPSRSRLRAGKTFRSPAAPLAARPREARGSGAAS